VTSSIPATRVSYPLPDQGKKVGIEAQEENPSERCTIRLCSIFVNEKNIKNSQTVDNIGVKKRLIPKLSI
jgi:hypothetical protein